MGKPLTPGRGAAGPGTGARRRPPQISNDVLTELDKSPSCLIHVSGLSWVSRLLWSITDTSLMFLVKEPF